MAFLQLVPVKITEHNQKDTYFLSESSICASEYESKLNRILVKEFWLDNERLTEAMLYIERIYHYLLPKYANILNDITGKNANVLFWERIIGGFLRSYLHVMYDKYEKLKLGISKIENLNIDVLNKSCFQIPLNYYDFSSAIRCSLIFNLQCYSIILDTLVYPNTSPAEMDWSLNNEAEEIKRDTKRTFKSKILSYLDSFLYNGKNSEISLFVTLFNKKSLLKLFLISNGRISPIIISSQTKKNITPDYQIRKRLVNIKPIDDFSDCAIKGMPSLFPLEYLEGFSKSYLLAESKLKISIPKVIVTGIGFAWDTDFAIWAAVCGMKGSKIYGLQHGGTYGELEPTFTELLERKISDKFITWGWSEDEKTIPLVSPKLMNYKKVDSSKNTRILWITTLDSREPYFLSHVPFGERFYKYFEFQKSFFNSLSPAIKEQIEIRLYPDDLEWDCKNRWRKIFPNIKFADEKKSLINLIKEAKLVIIDHLGGTSTLECLKLNIPLVIAADKSLFKIRKSAESYYSLLEKNEILHYEKKSFSNLINKISPSPLIWWNEDKRKKEIKKFKNNFLKESNESIFEWKRILLKD